MFIILFFSLINNVFCQDILLKSMIDELNVSYEKLKNAEKYPMYFIGYEAWKRDLWDLRSEIGSIIYDKEYKEIVVGCDVRIGSYTLDSTHEIKSDSWQNIDRGVDVRFITENDENSIKVELWNLTQETYKEAVNRYIKVITNKDVTAKQSIKGTDFTNEKTSYTYINYLSKEELDKKKIKDMVKRLSLIFKKYDFIIESNVVFSKDYTHRYIVNSDGARIVEGARRYSISYYASARTSDGMDLTRYKNYHFSKISDLPDENKIARDIENSIDELKKLLVSNEFDPQAVPAILENKAAAVFWHEIFGHRIEGHRQKSEREGQTFVKKLGQKIMPEFITIYDDPDIEYYNGKFLNGNYKYDDEGVKSQKVVLVEKGILKGFLMQRIGVLDFNKSNGHGRRSYGNMVVSRQGNLIIESSKKISYNELKKMLINEIKRQNKPFGLIIKDIEGGFTITKRNMPQSYTILVKYAVKVYPDGKEEPVRGFNMIGTPLQTFSKILATADDYDVFNGVCGAESGWINISAVSPSILFSEIETEKIKKSNQKPPILKLPYFDREER